jgi:hypothetical protein
MWRSGWVCSGRRLLRRSSVVDNLGDEIRDTRYEKSELVQTCRAYRT